MKKHLAIYYIATSNYKMGFEHFKRNLKYFYPEFKKTVVIISDGLNEWDGIIEDDIVYIVKHINHSPWPTITLFKHKYILDNLIECDYACYFNGNLQYNPKYDTTLEKINLNKLNVSRAVFCNENSFEGDGFDLAWAIDKNSEAYIEHNYLYIQGGLFIGPKDIVKKFCQDICQMRDKDLQRNIIPQWHDESYANKWCVLNPKLISPKRKLISYQCFEANYPFAVIETIEKDRRTEKRYYEN